MREKISIYALLLTLGTMVAHAGIGSSGAGNARPGDSILFFSTYLGGPGFEQGAAVFIDGEGNTILAGRTRSEDFPLVNPPPTTGFGGGLCVSGFSGFPCADVFVAKFDPDGNLLYSTVFGGSEDDWVQAVALDSQGEILVAGWTRSVDFPVMGAVTGGDSLRGFQDIFVARLDASSGRLLSSTYLGGSGSDEVADVALAGDGSILLAGRTSSADFPGLAAGQPAVRVVDALLAVLSPDASEVLFSLAWGGSEIDVALGLDIDGEGKVALVGSTTSDDFPTVAALQPRNRTGSGDVVLEGTDGFVAKLDLETREWIFMTYLGGLGDDAVRDVVAGSEGTLYITGEANSLNFPTRNALQPACRMGLFGCLHDAFVARISGDGSELLFSTFLGGGSFDAAHRIRRLPDGNLLVAGQSRSRDFPRLNPLLDFRLDTNGGFLTLLAGDGSRLLQSTHFPAVVEDLGVRDRSILITGEIGSGLPLVHPHQADPGGADAYLVRIAQPRSALTLGSYFQTANASRVAIVNFDEASPAEVALEFFDRNGLPAAGSLQGVPDQGRTRLSVPAGGFRILNGGLPPDLEVARAGSVRALSSRYIGAFLINDVADPERSLPIQESVVPARPARRFVFPVLPVRESDAPGAPVTLQILSLWGFEETQMINLELRDAQGAPIASCFVPLPARGGANFEVRTLGFRPRVDFDRFEGTVVLSAAADFSADVLLLTQLGFAALPPAPLSSAPAPSPTDGGFAQFIDGGGIARSRLLLVNAEPERSGEAVVEIRDPDGRFLGTRLNGVAFDGSARFALEPGAMLDLRSSGEGPLRTGSVRVSSEDLPLTAYLLLEIDGGGVTTLELAGPSRSFLAPVQSGGGFTPGIALVGADSDQVVQLELRDADGQTVARAEVLLGAGGQINRLVADLPWDAPPDFSSFLGTLAVEAETEVGAAVIWMTPPPFPGLFSELAAVPVWVREWGDR